jgi:hypothetical protein
MADNPHIQYNFTIGDRIDSLTGLARLSPYYYIGDNDPSLLTVTGYSELPALKHFKLNASELRGKNDPEVRSETDTIFDLDTRHLYFGHNSVVPQDSNVVIGELNGGFPEGNAVAGLPVRLQQVHFRGFNPSGISDEFSAFFLVSDPISGFNANNSANFSSFSESTDSIEGVLDSDYKLHSNDAIISNWTNTEWSNGSDKQSRSNSSKGSFGERLVIGDPLTVETNDYFQTESFSDDLLYDLDPNPKNNTYSISFDTGSLFVKQENFNSFSEGHAYQYPMDAIVSAKSIFHTGYYRHNSTCGVDTDNFDSVTVDFYDKDDEFRKDQFLLTRPDPTKKFDVLTSYDGERWVSNEVPIFFSFKVAYDSAKKDEDGTHVTIDGGYVYVNGVEHQKESITKTLTKEFLVLEINLGYEGENQLRYLEYDNVTDIPDDTDTIKYVLIASVQTTYCGIIKQFQLGDIYINEPSSDTGGTGGGDGEILNFAFKTRISGNDVIVDAGRIYIHNIDAGANNFLQSEQTTFAGAAINNTTYYLKVDRKDTSTTKVVIAAFPTQLFESEGEFWYPIAKVENRVVTQYQLGYIYDRNLPDLIYWPEQTQLGSQYDVLQLDHRQGDNQTLYVEIATLKTPQGS